MTFDKTLLKRDDKNIQKLLSDGKDGITISKPLYVLFPERFSTSGLAKITSKIEVTGIVLIMDDKHNYTVMSLPNMVSFLPNTIETITVNDKPHMLLEFVPPHFIGENTVLDTDDIAVQIIDEFCIKNNCPFYASASDLIKLLGKIPITTSSRVIFDPIVTELLVTLPLKTFDGKSSARTTLNKKEMDDINKMSIIGIGNVASFNNNISRISGGYFNDGLTYGLDDDNPEKTELDDIFRL